MWFVGALKHLAGNSIYWYYFICITGCRYLSTYVYVLFYKYNILNCIKRWFAIFMPILSVFPQLQIKSIYSEKFFKIMLNVTK